GVQLLQRAAADRAGAGRAHPGGGRPRRPGPRGAQRGVERDPRAVPRRHQGARALELAAALHPRRGAAPDLRVVSRAADGGAVVTAAALACRSCGSAALAPIVSLGAMPLANSYLKPEALAEPEARYPLDLVRCRQCQLVQITHVVP